MHTAAEYCTGEGIGQCNCIDIFISEAFGRPSLREKGTKGFISEHLKELNVRNLDEIFDVVCVPLIKLIDKILIMNTTQVIEFDTELGWNMLSVGSLELALQSNFTDNGGCVFFFFF